MGGGGDNGEWEKPTERERVRKGEKEIGDGPSDGKRDYQMPLSKGNMTVKWMWECKSYATLPYQLMNW